jgi:hypothetical protein
MAARSTRVKVINFTEQTFRTVDEELLHGIWTIHVPRRIDPQDTVEWASESQGLLTGTEGSGKLKPDDGSGIITLHWNNPYIGSNSYSHSAPEGYQVSFRGGAGDNAEVVFQIRRNEPSRSYPALA